MRSNSYFCQGASTASPPEFGAATETVERSSLQWTQGRTLLGYLEKDKWFCSLKRTGLTYPRKWWLRYLFPHFLRPRPSHQTFPSLSLSYDGALWALFHLMTKKEVSDRRKFGCMFRKVTVSRKCLSIPSWSKLTFSKLSSAESLK